MSQDSNEKKNRDSGLMMKISFVSILTPMSVLGVLE